MPRTTTTADLLAHSIETFCEMGFNWIKDEEWLDDDFENRKDALDCETVSFASVETALALEAHEADLIADGHYEPYDDAPDYDEFADLEAQVEARFQAQLKRRF